ncbi:MAG: N-6 DNA methylase [Candidatus Sumerlaeia bacterium]|nr:N-6 DNA methylase [Candidatus Sumerlaeia bacterium]
MLDTETKRRIDTARDILVGKVPDPKSQVEQITIALIYKFMDDMDAEAEELGGRRKFFSGDYARYGWAKLMRSGLGGHETLALYAEAIARMPENPGIPLLFRDIFKNAYLPYRDPETLKGFLKIIDEFQYDHSERLGDAFEYLLSVLGSQGDAGQFRTPRHIIDFIVAVIDPKKHETVLDPAFGTAGFLISAYKHILRANSLPSPSGPSSPSRPSQNNLTPDERGRLAQNFKGYDISPDMVRLSLVNLYLHGFTDPHIYEYDTLTSQDRWNEYADVILANPPFMSPKGGIKPHNRFGVQSKRSEVLFVDYMAEHLTPNGRAAIIVPEGIIFQSQTAYTQLRKMLVDDYLVAVISLPAGVFQPYSGVKTSVLILDKALAKKAPTIAFFKVENDGFGLGAQRRPMEGSNLPAIQTALAEYLQTLRTGTPPTPSIESIPSISSLIIPKEKIAANGDYNLSGERYREGSSALRTFSFIAIGEIAQEIKAGFACGQSSVDTKGVPHIRPMNVTDKGQFTWEGLKQITSSEYEGREDYALKSGDVLFNNTNSKELVGKTCLIENDIHGGFSNHMTRIRVKPDVCNPNFLALILHNAWTKGIFLELANRWIGQAGINATSLAQFQIPLPPLSVQKEIVAEIEAYQKVIDGARAVLDNYRPHIPIDPKWPIVALGEVTEINPKKSELAELSGDTVVSFVPMATLGEHTMTFEPQESKLLSEVGASYTYFRNNDVLIAKVTPCFENGKAGIARNLCNGIGFGSSEFFVIRCSEVVLPEWAYFSVANTSFRASASEKMTGTGGLQRVPRSVLEEHLIPIPPLSTQRAIVAEIEAEQALVNANRDLIARMERKIQATLARVWGEST